MEPYDDREPAPVQVLWGRVAVLGGALVLAFLLGMFVSGNGSPTEEQIKASDPYQNLRAENEDLANQNEQLNQQLDQLSRGGTPTDAPTVGGEQNGESQSGDSSGGDGSSGNGDSGSNDSDARVYVVRQGDTLSQIAQRFYGSAGLEARERIAEENGIEPDATLQVGDELTIPSTDG
jgi:nucleoid-associated protein YgaU